MRNVAFIGLILNTLGTALVWRFGLPQDVRRHGHGYFLREQVDEEEKKKAKRFDFISNLGMGLILLGFILQAVAIYCL